MVLEGCHGAHIAMGDGTIATYISSVRQYSLIWWYSAQLLHQSAAGTLQELGHEYLNSNSASPWVL